MMWAHFPFPPAGYRRKIHGCLKSFWVHGRYIWFKTDINAFLFAQGSIARNGTGIFGEVFMGTELRRIDEDADYERIASQPGCSNQRPMPIVQRPHSRHEPNPYTFTPEPLSPGGHATR